MKIRITFKTPDVLEQSIEDAIDNTIDDGRSDISLEQREELRDKAKDVCNMFIEFSECITVEIDTETKECTVVPL